MRIASRSPQRIRARRPHYLMRDLENHPTHSMIEVSGTLSDGGPFPGFRIIIIPEPQKVGSHTEQRSNGATEMKLLSDALVLRVPILLPDRVQGLHVALRETASNGERRKR